MDLSTRFRPIALSMKISIGAMVPGRHNSIEYAERVGTSVVFTITHAATDTLPLRYARVVADLDIADINSDRIWRCITYKGYCR
jgi:hypothetical protein